MTPTFVVGTGRCGSTLVHEILARHEDFGFISNIEDNFSWIKGLGRWNNAFFQTPLGAFSQTGRLRFKPSEAYRLISREVSPIYANSFRDLFADDVSPWLRERFVEFFESRQKAQGRRCFLHKYTGWARIGFFRQIFPGAKFIHIVRDGRAVANSWLQMPWWVGYRGPENWLWGELPTMYRDEWESSGRSFVRLAAISWKILMDAFERAEEGLAAEEYLRLRYEDILADPRDHFGRILDFCGAPWTRRFEQRLVAQKFRTDRCRAFEADLTKGQIQQLEVSLTNHLDRYGYE